MCTVTTLQCTFLSHSYILKRFLISNISILNGVELHYFYELGCSSLVRNAKISPSSHFMLFEEERQQH